MGHEDIATILGETLEEEKTLISFLHQSPKMVSTTRQGRNNYGINFWYSGQALGKCITEDNYPYITTVRYICLDIFRKKEDNYLIVGVNPGT